MNCPDFLKYCVVAPSTSLVFGILLVIPFKFNFTVSLLLISSLVFILDSFRISFKVIFFNLSLKLNRRIGYSDL